MNGSITDKRTSLKNKCHTKVKNQDRRIVFGTVVKQSLLK